MTAKELFTVKGVGERLLFTCLGPTWIESWQAIQVYISENKTFLHNAIIIIDLRDLEIRSADLFNARDFCYEHQITISAIYAKNHETNQAAALLGIPTQHSEKETATGLKLSNQAMDKAVLIHRTLRSGTLVDVNCDIVVFGDVHSGAVIRSDKNIIIWGKLMGEAHAGRSGDASAVICALELIPAGLKIAGIPFDSTKRKPKEPEVAILEENAVKIISWMKITY
jgi:septum site-determining protein MinC